MARDVLSLGRAPPDRWLPVLVACMAFLAALALAGAVGASGLAAHWQGGAALRLVQVPDPDQPAGARTRADAVAAALAGEHFRRLTPAELAGLLRPWLGDMPALPLPAVFQLAPGADDPVFTAALQRAAPGTLVNQGAAWVARLQRLADSLQACAGLALGVVGLVATLMVALATWAGLAARREAVRIVHGLGATDSWIAAAFSRRVFWQALVGGAAGVTLSLPLLLGLAALASPFEGGTPVADTTVALASLPRALWEVLPVVPAAAAAIGWLVAQFTVRHWLRHPA